MRRRMQISKTKFARTGTRIRKKLEWLRHFREVSRHSLESLRPQKLTRKLPALKKPEDWEPKTMIDGARAVLDRGMSSAVKELQSSASDFLVGEGFLVAQATVQASVKFMTDLSTWMTREYLELR